MILNVTNGAGTLAVEVSGAGPLVVCVPGMGESRSSFRHLTSRLTDAGYRVAVMDLRGHGDSSVNFAAYDDPAAADDILAVVDALGGGPATIIGNSMGAAAAVLAASARPDAMNGLMLIGPFVRNHGSAAGRALMQFLLARPWGPSIWRGYYRSLFGQKRVSDHDEHVIQALELLRRPGRWRAFQATARSSHAAAEAALPQVDTSTLVVMGDKDRDFPDPGVEARWVAAALHGEYTMIPGAGHYPMGEQPEAVSNKILPFLDALTGKVRTHG